MLVKRACLALIVFLFVCSYSFAQESQPQEEVPQNASPAEAQVEPQVFQPQQPPPPPPQILSPSDIPQGFGAQVKPAEPPPPEPVVVQEAVPEPQPEPKPVVVEAPVVIAYPTYEVFLDSVELFAKELFVEKQKLDSIKAAINEETLQPKGQYEKQADYDSRKANFDKTKQQKISAAEKDNSAREKKAKEKLLSAINYGKDIQPDWQELLLQNANADEYKRRIDKFTEKISDMNIAITRVNNFLSRLSISQSDLDALAKKNNLYIARLERASDLMRDYILQDYSKVLSTEKKAFSMSLSPYDVEKEEYTLNLRDINSQTVPFDYYGVIKVSPSLAQAIDNKTNDFTAIIDYVNYPFTAYGVVVYPGAKKANIYFRDEEFASTGAFKSLDGYDKLEGYVDWAVRVDSLINGKLVPKHLDSSYAMKKVSVGPYYWNATRVLRVVAFGLSATSLGLGIWQNSSMNSKAKSANKLYAGASDAVEKGNEGDYLKNASAYDKKINSMQNSQYARNGFYISAGVFGIAGIASFYF